MNILNFVFYLTLLVVTLEIIKTVKRSLRGSNIVVFIQLVALVIALIVLWNNIFTIVPVSIAIVIVADWIRNRRNKEITLRRFLLGFLLSTWLILVGLVLIVFGLVKS